MASFLSSIADKAQSAINASPLAKYAGSQTDGAEGKQGPSSTSTKSHTLGALHHQLRQLGQQYGSATPVQKIITTSKGVAIDFDSVSRDAKAQSKELYMWGQEETEDIKDVTDRLAFMNFVQGALAATVAAKIDTSRAAFKALRDAETALVPRRNIRAGLQTQISRLEHGQEKGYEKRLAELHTQLQKAEKEDEPQENELKILKRKAIIDSETAKWEALREYGEKLSLVAQASSAVIGMLPIAPPTSSMPYSGKEGTAAARASLQRALDTYKPGQTTLMVPASVGADLNRNDTRSFGETHAHELDTISTGDASAGSHPNLPLTPPGHDGPQTPVPTPHSTTSNAPPTSFTQPSVGAPTIPLNISKKNSIGSPPLDPATLNHEPAPLPSSPPVNTHNSISPAVPVDPINPSAKVPSITPTVAETGMPLSASEEGPGPASGSLKALREERAQSPPSAAAGAGPASYGSPVALESADDEKKRLERAERERVLAGQASPAYETAEDEKKRLEREERERVLAGGGNPNLARSGTVMGPPGEDLPPYQEPGEF